MLSLREPDIKVGSFAGIGYRDGQLYFIPRTTDAKQRVGEDFAVNTRTGWMSYLETIRTGLTDPDKGNDEIAAERNDIRIILETLGNA